MKARQSADKRTYSTRLVKTEQPLDLTVFCEMVARQMLCDAKYTKMGENKNGQVH